MKVELANEQDQYDKIRFIVRSLLKRLKVEPSVLIEKLSAIVREESAK